MARIRIIFQKTGWFTLINHLELPIIFSRSARRAGLSQEFSQGFSPRPRLSLGPPLAAGVVGLDEPADFWFNDWGAGSLDAWNAKLPRGLKILRGAETDGPSLAKLATAAVYKLRGVDSELGEEALSVLEETAAHSGELFGSSLADGTIVLKTGDLEHCGAGNLVRALAGRGLITGWRGVMATRERVGTIDRDSGVIFPLV